MKYNSSFHQAAHFFFQGNVALDVARVLLRPTTELATTDIASHALAALKESAIRFLVLLSYNVSIPMLSGCFV